jgi:hypothetical protein
MFVKQAKTENILEEMKVSQEQMLVKMDVNPEKLEDGGQSP